MAPKSRLDVTPEREAPTELLAQLRERDPLAELVYMGWGYWMLGRIDSSSLIREAGERLLASIARVQQRHQRKGLTPVDFRRHLMGRLRLNGFQPTSEYRFQGEPTAKIVRDQEVMDFLYRHTTDTEFLDALDAERVKARAEAHAELTDDARAKEAWRYAFTTSHSVTRFDDPAKRRARSGRILHKVVAA